MTDIIKKDYSNKERVLIHNESGNRVQSGEFAETFRGERVRIDGGAPPHKCSSTGHIYMSQKVSLLLLVTTLVYVVWLGLTYRTLKINLN